MLCFGKRDKVKSLNEDNTENRHRKSEFRRTFRPLFIVLMVCGLDISGGPKCGCFRRFYTRTICVLVMLSQASFGYMNLYEIRLKGIPMTDASFQVTLALIAFEVVMVYLMFLIRWSKFTQFVDSLDEACQDILGNNPQIYRTIRWFIFSSVIFIVIIGLLTIYLTDEDDESVGLLIMNYTLANITSNNTDDEYYNYGNYKSFDRSCMIEASMLHTLLVLFCFNVTIMVLKNFTFLGKSTAIGVNNDAFLTMPPTETTNYPYFVDKYSNRPASTIFLKRHDNLCSIVRQMNEAFSEIVIIWNVSELASVIFILRAMNFGDVDSNFEFQDLGIGLLSIIMFVVKSLCAASINEQILESVRHLTDVDESTIAIGTGLDRTIGRARPTIFEKQEIKCRMYARYIQVDPPSLTGWGFYSIRKGFVLAAAGNVVTYVLVLYNTK